MNINHKPRLIILALTSIPTLFRQAVEAQVIADLLKIGFTKAPSESYSGDAFIYVNLDNDNRLMVRGGQYEDSAVGHVNQRNQRNPLSHSHIFTAEEYYDFLKDAKSIFLAWKEVKTKIDGVSVTITQNEITLDPSALLADVEKKAKALRLQEFGS